MANGQQQIASTRPRIGEVLRRGMRRKCPRCGEGELFRRGIAIHERCSQCHLLYQRDRGDTLMFMFITDRIPILFGIAAVYFGFRSTNWMVASAFLLALVTPMIATIRQRQGIALALDYLSRVYMPDPSDEIHRANAA
ncbi:MAG: hypothetical protein ACXV7D_00995 [Thermoanaerobaculia bacterium]